MSANDLPSPLRSLAAAMKVAKNRSVRGGADPWHIVDAYRAGRRILRVAVPEPEDCLTVFYNAPGAMSADYIAVAADSWVSTSATNPITGEGWEFGDMQRIVEQDLGLHRGLIEERIMLAGFARDGDSPMGLMRYVSNRAARTITWSPPIVCDRSDGADGIAPGRFPRVAREGFARPDLLAEVVDLIGEPPEGYDVEEMRRRAAVTWVLGLPSEKFRVIEGPKGPPLASGIPARYGPAPNHEEGT